MLMDLREYEQTKFKIAEVLRSASAIAGPEQRVWKERSRELSARLAEDRFNLVVVGRFSRGKSTLMNAILAMDRLPTGIVPLTSVITTVTYGSKERVVLRFRDSMLSTEIPIAELPKYVTQEGNPGNAKRIETAEVQLPAELLRRGFYFVDTPGLGSAVAANTRTTESFLPEGDAFLLVTSYESPLSDEEMRFFRVAMSSSRRTFVALNKHDIVSADDRANVLTFVHDQLRIFLDRRAPKVFSVSARDGLEAKLSGDSTRLQASGVPALEDALLKFLLSEKRAQFLLGMCNRVTDLVRELPGSPACLHLLKQMGAQTVQLDAQRHPISADCSLVSSPNASFRGLHQLAPCEICMDVANATWDALCRYQYEISTDLSEQHRFATTGGLCHFHTWQYHTIVSSQATSTAYPALAERLGAWFSHASTHGFDQENLLAQLESLLPSEDRCALCRVHGAAEANAIAIVAQRLSNQSNALDSLSAICIPHVGLLAVSIRDIALVRKLLARHAAILERISEDMRRYAIKREGSKRFMLSEEEEKSANRAIMLLAGHKDLRIMHKIRYDAAHAIPNTPCPNLCAGTSHAAASPQGIGSDLGRRQ
jgi:small GTP-binding protein